MLRFLPQGITTKKSVFLAAGFIQTVLAIITLSFTWDIYQGLLESQLRIAEGTQAFQAWQETPIPIYSSFYFFHIINPKDFVENHAKPVLEERGPYVFREKEEKVDLVWNNNNATVSYKRRKFWWFEPEMSAGPLTDTVMTLNLPLVGAAAASKNDFLMQWALTDVFATMEAELFINKTVGELLFEGYEDELITIADAYKEDEVAIPLDRFGWFYGRNGTTWSDGDLSMYTGEDDINKLGEIASWNFKDSTDAFSGECGKLKGSSDGLFAPGQFATREKFQVFATDVCRPLDFTKAGTETKHGITSWKYKLAEDVFNNHTDCPDKACYNNYLPHGVQNVTQCKMSSPAFVSRPHFHGADPFYKDQFQYGIFPDPARHDSHFMVEPRTSIPLEVSMRLQINILLEKNEGIQHIFHELPRVFFPVMWFESVASLPKEMAGSLSLLVDLPIIMQATAVVGICMGVMGMLTATYCMFRRVTEDEHVTCEYAKVSIKETTEQFKPILKNSVNTVLLCSEKA